MNAAIIFAIVCVAVASAVPLSQNVVLGKLSITTKSTTEPAVELVNYLENDNIGVGPYNFMFETSDGQKREEHAQTIVQNDEPQQVVSGSYSFVDLETQKEYTVHYTADKDGFHATGDHLPKAAELVSMPMAKKTLI